MLSYRQTRLHFYSYEQSIHCKPATHVSRHPLSDIPAVPKMSKRVTSTIKIVLCIERNTYGIFITSMHVGARPLHPLFCACDIFYFHMCYKPIRHYYCFHLLDIIIFVLSSLSFFEEIIKLYSILCLPTYLPSLVFFISSYKSEFSLGIIGLQLKEPHLAFLIAQVYYYLKFYLSGKVFTLH